MAQVPLAEGPRVNPVVPDAKPISILEPKESRITASAIGGMQNSQNVLSKAANDAYNRMNEARATEAFNSIKIAVTDLMLGENGALRQVGSQVVDRKKPFVEDYMEQIEKISEQYCEGLTAEQKRLNQERIRLYVTNRRTELLNHSIQQAEAYQKNVAKTTARISGEAIATNARNIDEVNEAIENIRKAVDVYQEGDAPEVRKATTEKLVSTSLVSAIELALENNQPEQAEALRLQWRGKGLSVLDEMKMQAKIRTALKEKKTLVDTEQALAKIGRAVTDEGLMSSILPKASGKEFDAEEFKKIATLATEKGFTDKNGMTTVAMYILGYDKCKEMTDAYDKEVEIYRQRHNEWERAKAEAVAQKKAFEQEEPVPPSLTFTNKLNPAQRAVFEEFNITKMQLHEGNEEAFIQQISRAVPELTENPKLMKKVVDGVLADIKIKRAQTQAVQGTTAQSIYSRLQNGAKWEEIPITERDRLSEGQRAGLQNYAKRSTGKMSTDATLYCDYIYNPEKLKDTPLCDLYEQAWQFSNADFARLIQVKTQLDKGAEIKDPTKGVKSIVEDLLVRSGYKPEGSSERKLAYDIMKREIIEAIVDKQRLEPNKVWQDKDVRLCATTMLDERFETAGVLWGKNTSRIADIVSNKSGWGELDDLLDEALKDVGYSDPKRLDRNVLVLRLLLNPSRPIIGEQTIAQKVKEKPEYWRPVRNALQEMGYKDFDLDSHLIAKCFLLGELNRKDKMK